DGDYRTAAGHRPVATAAGLFSCARALRKTSGPGITGSSPRRRRGACVKRSPQVFEKEHSSLASFTARSGRAGLFPWTEPQRDCCCNTRTTWDCEDAVRTGPAKTDSRTQAVAPQGVSRERLFARRLSFPSDASKKNYQQHKK